MVTYCVIWLLYTSISVCARHFAYFLSIKEYKCTLFGGKKITSSNFQVEQGIRTVLAKSEGCSWIFNHNWNKYYSKTRNQMISNNEIISEIDEVLLYFSGRKTWVFNTLELQLYYSAVHVKWTCARHVNHCYGDFVRMTWIFFLCHRMTKI